MILNLDDMPKSIFMAKELKMYLNGFGRKLFSQTMKNTLKSAIQKGAEEAIKKAATKCGDYIAKYQVIKLWNC